MKKIYTFLLVTSVIGNVYAQDSVKKVSFLVKGGVNFSNYAASESKKANNINDKNLLGLNFGVAANYKLSNSIALQTGLSFNQKGYINQFEIEDRNEINEDLGTTTIHKTTQRVSYLELPINAIYNYKKVSLGLGPYLAYAIKATSVFQMSKPVQGYSANHKFESDMKIGNDKTSVVKPLEFGLNFLVDYEFKYGISIGANYGLGITNASKLIFVREGKNRVFSVLVGYKFSRLKPVKAKEEQGGFAIRRHTSIFAKQCLDENKKNIC